MIGGPGGLRGTALAAVLAGVSCVAAVLAAGQEADTRQPSPDSRKLLEMGDYRGAELSGRAELVGLEAAGEMATPALAAVLEVVAEAMVRGGRVRGSDARVLAERAVAIRSEVQGSDHLDTGGALALLATVLRREGEASSARTAAERSVAIREAVVGREHPAWAESVNALAGVVYDSGDFTTAVTLYAAVVDVRERTLGPEHPDTGDALQNLARALRRRGDTNGAQIAFRRALAIMEAVFGADHMKVAGALNDIASLRKSSGDFAGARPDLERVLAIYEKSLGAEHPFVAGVLNNLADLNMKMGDRAAARRLLERSLSIRERALPPDHPEIAQSLNNLGLLLVKDDDPAGARRLLTRALAIREQSLPAGHREIALSLANLGWVLQELGAAQEALLAHERARAIREVVQGAEHWETAQSRLGIGEALAALGRLEEARSEVEHALRVFRHEWGDVHPRVGHGWLTLARIRARQGDTAGALEAALQAEDVGSAHLRAVAHLVSEREALEYAAVRVQGRDLALSLLTRPGITDEQRARAWEAVARSRGLVTEMAAERMRVAAHPAGRISAALVQEYIAAVDALAQLMVRGDSSGDGGQTLAAAIERRERAERELATACPALETRRTQDRLSLTEVAAALPAATTLVSFIQYRPDPVVGGGRLATTRQATPHYLALVLAAGSRTVQSVPLGPAPVVDGLVAAWLDEASSGAGTTGRTPGEALLAYRRAGRELRRAVWDPVAHRLGEARMVLLVPAAGLHLVSWGALPTGQAGYLVEAGPLVHLLTGEHEVLAEPGPLGSGLLALGAAAFDADVLPVAVGGGEPRTDGVLRGGWRTCEDHRTVRFGPIAASGREALEVAELWRQASRDAEAGEAVVLSGAAATEEAFSRSSSGRRIIHLATHGFFLDGECGPASGGERGIGGLAPAGASPERGASGIPPLAGLAMAGANRRQEGAPGREDGVLTAEEAALLDLVGAEWVVLSACDTGRGRVHLGEGVLGLQRAFRIAGARTVIMSLWGVADEPTREWMNALYTARLMEGHSTAASVAEASRRVLADRRARRESSHPMAWGAFVAAGDWR